MDNASEVKNKGEEEDKNMSNERQRVVLDSGPHVHVLGRVGLVHPLDGNPTLGDEDKLDQHQKGDSRQSEDQLEGHHHPEES